MLVAVFAGMLVASHVDGGNGGLHVLAAAGAGYGVTGFDVTCLYADSVAGSSVSSSCNDGVNSVALNLGVGALWGETARFGVRVDGTYAPSTSHNWGALTDAFAVARYSGVVIVEAGVGAGYVWAHRDTTEHGAGFAGSFLLGVPLSAHWAVFTRGVFVTGEPGAGVATLGAEWSL